MPTPNSPERVLDRFRTFKGQERQERGVLVSGAPPGLGGIEARRRRREPPGSRDTARRHSLRAAFSRRSQGSAERAPVVPGDLPRHRGIWGSWPGLAWSPITLSWEGDPV